MKRATILFALGLSACSGASRVCDDVSGACVITFRDSGSSSSVTAYAMFDRDGKPFTGRLGGSVGAGWLAEINPLAALAPAAAGSALQLGADAKAIEQ